MTLDYDAKVALWHRLRNDPDFQPEWLKAMGQQPPAPEASHHRVWGDGIGDKREHVIRDISFREGWVLCQCGIVIDGGPKSHAWLEDAWNLHRGLSPERIASSRLTKAVEAMATNAEVGTFLARAADPAYAYEPE